MMFPVIKVRFIILKTMKLFAGIIIAFDTGFKPLSTAAFLDKAVAAPVLCNTAAFASAAGDLAGR